MNDQPRPSAVIALAIAIAFAVCLISSQIEAQNFSAGAGPSSSSYPSADAGSPVESSAGRRDKAGDAGMPSSHHRLPIPRDQWTPSAEIVLARCLVGESGFAAPLDHAAIAWVLAKRWHRYVRNNPGTKFTFFDQIQSYCRGASPRASSRDWVKRLPRRRSDPWPPGASNNEARWWEIRSMLHDWSRGRVIDPHPSATHWGGRMDPPKNGMIEISSKTKNILYRIEHKK